MSEMNEELLPDRLVQDIIAVRRMKGTEFDRTEVQGCAVLFFKGDTVVFRHSVIHPGTYT
jgi:hypothetical protein